MSAKDRLIAEAIVTYADACTLPHLTKGCPFYRVVDGSPTCGEECRGVASDLGAPSREERTVDVGGIRMHGRALPISAAGGTSDWDAMRDFLRDKEKEPRDQSTAALLGSLASVVSTNAVREDASRLREAMTLWGEAERRFSDFDAVFAAGIAEQAATAVVARVVLTRLHELQRVDMSDVLPARAAGQPTWLAAAEASAGHIGTRPTRRSILDEPDPEILRSVLPQLFETDEQTAALVSDPLLAHALSGIFRRRVVRWLTSLLDHDLEATLSVRPPNPVMFAATRPTAPEYSVGLWLWERFTVTRVENWSSSSLAMEWDWTTNNAAPACDVRAMAERTIPAEVLSNTAMRRSIQRARLPYRTSGFEPGEYAIRASELLVHGEHSSAIAIFEGLVELSPGNAEAWNNLGFCQLVADPAASIRALTRAEALRRTPSLVTAANLALAHHMNGADDDALSVGRRALAWDAPADSQGAWLWEHPVSVDNGGPEASLALGEFDSPRAYLEDLVAHIEDTEHGVCELA